MTVAEAIEALKQEDPNSTLVVVLSRHRHEPLRRLYDLNGGRGSGFFDELKVDGKDSSYRGGVGTAVVLVAAREE